MFRNQLTQLFAHERIITTVAKAKDLRPQAEKMVTLARTGTLASRRRILSSISDADVVRKLFDDIAPRFADRPGGYTRIMRLGRRRGDGAELAIIEFVDYVPSEGEEAGGGPAKPSLMDRAKGMFGGGAKAEEDAADAAESDEEIGEEAAAVEDAPEMEAAPEPEAAEETADEAVAEPEEEPVKEAAAEPEPQAEEPVDEPAAKEPSEEQAETADEDDQDKKD
jgi:large subunit ribosomal protein L17